MGGCLGIGLVGDIWWSVKGVDSWSVEGDFGHCWSVVDIQGAQLVS